MTTRRTANSSFDSLDNAASSSDGERRPNVRIALTDNAIPLYQVDLSKPPGVRYEQICEDFKDRMAQLVSIYDQILSMSGFPRLAAFLARNLLRRVSSAEETAEMKGISRVTGVPMHLVVAYNTFLDLFAGCMSGGAQTRMPGSHGTKMIHFRNLDGGMDMLRDMVIRVEYVRDGKVIARALTYAGYLGVLTGVRKGLSMSMNYRTRVQSKSSKARNTLHYVSILLGFQPSIASQLRAILHSTQPPPSLDDLVHKFNKVTASSSYLTFCSPTAVLIIEKDLKSSTSHYSEDFLAVPNRDVSVKARSSEKWKEWVDDKLNGELGGIKYLLEDSIDHKGCVCRWWEEKGRGKVTLEDIKSWLRKYSIRNEMTHYSCIMDPSVEGGGLVWAETYQID